MRIRNLNGARWVKKYSDRKRRVLELLQNNPNVMFRVKGIAKLCNISKSETYSIVYYLAITGIVDKYRFETSNVKLYKIKKGIQT